MAMRCCWRATIRRVPSPDRQACARLRRDEVTDHDRRYLSGPDAARRPDGAAGYARGGGARAGGEPAAGHDLSRERKSVAEGKRVSARGDLGGRRISRIKNK